MTTWILVCDTGRATVLSTELRESPWELVQQFEHAEGREASREIESTAPPGRMQQGQTAGGHHTAFEPRTWPKQAEAQRFAQTLSDFLENSLAQRRYDHLVLVAPPHFLGLLKDSLGKQSAKLVRTSVNKDLAALATPEMRNRLLDAVFPIAASTG